MTGAAAAYASLYAPSAESLRRSLADIADGIFGQLMELHHRPDADTAADVAANLAGAQRAVLKLRERILAEGCGDER